MATFHQAKKRFGQNFLNDESIILDIVEAINPSPDDHLVEIGPGLGALTQQVLCRSGQLDVIELDRDIIPKLSRLCRTLGELRVHEADALKFDFSKLQKDNTPLKVFGNLPYNISTPLIFHLLTNAAIISEMHFMLQKEVVDRLAAVPGTKSYGKLSIMTQYYCHVEALFDVPPEAFTPKPKVDSAIVRLIPYTRTSEQSVANIDVLAKIVNSAFTQRRKTIRNSLSEWFKPQELEAQGLKATERAENIDVTTFVTLAQSVEKR
ncbi:MAG: 16S rRNA (adenine(1518)-N(6)/adenine(1519)-N(6))-dimethyltransferase RsmA [Pseudomonadota bacterium]